MVAVIAWSVLGLLVLLGVIVVVFLKKNDWKKRPVDYYAFFVMGVSWLPFGIVMMVVFPDIFVGQLFFVLGLVYFAIGISHKSEWKKPRGFSVEERRFKIWIVVLLGVVVLIGLVVFYLGSLDEEADREVDSFESCVAAGNPVMESYPRQCRDGDDLFVEDVSGSSRAEIGIEILPGRLEDKGYFCGEDSDCEIKDVHNCCGYYPRCVNKDYDPDVEAVERECLELGMGSVCGFPDISHCECRDGVCESMQGDMVV